jgi:hypothetical protein
MGIAQKPGSLRGYVTPERDGPFEVAVHLPADAGTVTAWANKHKVSHTTEGSVVRFDVPAIRATPADWAVTWSATSD